MLKPSKILANTSPCKNIHTPHTHAHTHAHMHTHMHTYRHRQTHAQTQTDTDRQTDRQTDRHTHTHTHTHTDTHTHTHKHKHIDFSQTFTPCPKIILTIYIWNFSFKTSNPLNQLKLPIIPSKTNYTTVNKKKYIRETKTISLT